jgi:hypothetical protein
MDRGIRIMSVHIQAMVRGGGVMRLVAATARDRLPGDFAWVMATGVVSVA